ncbi:MAG: type IV pilus assembly protein PilM [Candidatus Omnitrophota bacterium]
MLKKQLNSLIGHLPKRILKGWADKQALIGIDIGKTSIKAVRVKKSGAITTLTKTAVVDIDSPGDRGAIVQALKSVMAKLKPESDKIVFVLNSPQVSARKINAPHMPKKELAEAVRWAIKNIIPFSLDDAYMDFSVGPEVKDPETRKLNISVGAVPQETIEEFLDIFKQAGISLTAIIPAFSALRYIAKQRANSGKVIAVIEMGAGITDLIIYKNSCLEFARKIPMSGQDITNSLTGALITDHGRIQLSAGEAEKVKCCYGIPKEGYIEVNDGKISSTQVVALMRTIVEKLIDEIERSFDYYREESRGGSVDKIILLGGGSRLKGLAEVLKEGLNMEVSMGDVFDGMDAPSDIHNLEMALGSVWDEGKTINLLPEMMRHRPQSLLEKVSISGGTTLIIGLLVLGFMGMKINDTAYDKQLQAARVEYGAIALGLRNLKGTLLANQIFQDKPYWEDVLKELSNVLPANIHLTGVSLKEKKIYLQGMIQLEYKNEATLTKFMLLLEEGIFKNVTLVKTQKISPEVPEAEFEIKAEID